MYLIKQKCELFVAKHLKTPWKSVYILLLSFWFLFFQVIIMSFLVVYLPLLFVPVCRDIYSSKPLDCIFKTLINMWFWDKNYLCKTLFGRDLEMHTVSFINTYFRKWFHNISRDSLIHEIDMYEKNGNSRHKAVWTTLKKVWASWISFTWRGYHR